MIVQRQGETIEFESPFATDTEAQERLRVLVNTGLVSGDFAKSLAGAQHLSTRQAAWVHYLCSQVSGKTYPHIVALFVIAKRNGLKNPVIRTNELRLSVARARTSLLVYSKGKRFLGRIQHTGQYVGDQRAVEDLDRFEDDPLEYARIYGRRTSNCCFCGRLLETKESVFAGYGPICAEKFGLPWGMYDAE